MSARLATPARPAAGPRARLDRLAQRLDPSTRGGLARATLGMVVLCALVSLLRGQDTNWDLRNYHLHNAWSWLHGRFGVDLAPAQLQSYFVPWLDLPYYLLVQHAPAPVAGLFLGLLHGLVFLPLCWIAWRLLAGEPGRGRLALGLALAGMSGAAFLSELGNTMGDASTAALVLGALALCIPSQAGWAWGRIILAGLLLGTAVALKLTNALYALALGVALLATPLPWPSRLRAATLLAGSSLALLALLAGPWFYRVWSEFGNPLFPQFNAWFQGALARPDSVGDARWLPGSLGQALVWPLRITFDPQRVSEIALRQVIWAVLYLAALAAACRWLLRRLRRKGAAAEGSPDPATVMFAVYFIAAFVAWLAVFSIHRYLAALELLAPLALWMLLRRLAPARARLRTVAVAACAAVSLLGWNDWGHAGWSRQAARVEAPAMAGVGTVLVAGDQPNAWRLPFLPAGPAYAGVAGNFPESAAYAARVRAMVATGGGALALLSADAAAWQEQLRRKGRRNAGYNRWAALLGLDRGDCLVLRWAAGRSSSRVLVEPSQSSTGRCQLAMARDPAAEAAAAAAAATAERYRLRQLGELFIARYGLVLDVERCQVHRSWLGTAPYPYQLCPVALPPEAGA